MARVGTSHPSVLEHPHRRQPCPPRSLVVGPLKGVAWEKAPVVLVIDAVDEAGTDARSNGVLQVLSGCVGELPGWVRVLVTSRPEDYIVRQVARFQPFTLEPSEERNREDIRAYIRGSLRSEGLSEEERGAVVEALEGKSAGVFAYVAALVGMVQREVGAKVEGGVANMAVGDLPEGHRALYKEYFDRWGWAGGHVAVHRCWGRGSQGLHGTWTVGLHRGGACQRPVAFAGSSGRWRSGTWRWCGRGCCRRWWRRWSR